MSPEEKQALLHGILDVLWRVLRRIVIFLCSVAIIFGGVAFAYRYVTDHYLAPVDENDFTPVEVTIQRGSGKSTIARVLEEAGVIRSKSVFKLYVDIFGYASKLKAGTYILDPSMEYREILDKIAKGDGRGNTTNFIVIEGYNVEEMSSKLYENKKINNVNTFRTLCTKTDNLEYLALMTKMAEDVPADRLGQRKYLLEGYLFPDTYEIYVDASQETIIEKMAVKMDSIFNEERMAQCEALGMTPDEIITLASIIEKEAKPDDFAKVSAIFHLRLQKGMKLQSCATLQYALNIKRIVLTNDDTASTSPYNTYKYEGLPVGPICSPSEKAIDAALNPDTDFMEQGYLYFVTTDPESGTLEFNITAEAHEAAAEKYRPLWIAYDEKQAANPENPKSSERGFFSKNGATKPQRRKDD